MHPEAAFCQLFNLSVGRDFGLIAIPFGSLGLWGLDGRLPKWPTGADCKSAGLRLRWFESITYHHSLKRLSYRRFSLAKRSRTEIQNVRFCALADFCRLFQNDAQKAYKK